MAGCQTVSSEQQVAVFDGMLRPAPAVATVKCGSAVAVRAINANRKYGGEPGCELYVPEGWHAFSVGIQHARAETGAPAVEHTITFMVVPGLTYWINASNDGRQHLPWEIVVTNSAAKPGEFVIRKRARH